jgi:transposase
MYRVRLTDAQRQELKQRAHAPGVKPRTRDRLEMVRLSDAGWSIPRIARHLDLSEQTVRYWIKTFLTDGFDALPDQPHRGQASAITPAIEAAIRQELRRDERTWTAPQLADWLGERFGVHRTAAHLARRLDRAAIAYKRTGRSLKHKQNPDDVAAKEEEMAALEKRGTSAKSTASTSTKQGSR